MQAVGLTARTTGVRGHGHPLRPQLSAAERRKSRMDEGSRQPLMSGVSRRVCDPLMQHAQAFRADCARGALQVTTSTLFSCILLVVRRALALPLHSPTTAMAVVGIQSLTHFACILHLPFLAFRLSLLQMTLTLFKLPRDYPPRRRHFCS